MWIGEVDIPQALVEAHRNGELVLFVGAGASRGEPSSLPDFRELTRVIATTACVPFTEGQLDRPDVLLGELKDRHNVDVHQRVAALIGVETSQPNRLHESLGALASAGPEVRIVTTNYDRHLSTILTRHGATVTEYTAPALPLGNDFEGLVYLHGSLDQLPARLVVTDADFGRAYLSDAWATRFLERMFATYAVVFVGYSHDDVVMRYLARGLRGAGRRYAFTPDNTQETDWRTLGITAVIYPNGDGSHVAVVDAIGGWARTAAMGLLDHRQRIARLLEAPPPQIPEDISYLQAVMADGDKVKFFTEFARSREWLSWASFRPEIKQLFDPAPTATACTVPLAAWFAQHCVLNPDLSAHALSMVQQAGSRIGPDLWWAIAQAFHALNGPRPDGLGPWLVMLVQNAPEQTYSLLEYALDASRWPEDRAAALMLFDHLTEPVVALRPSFSDNPSPSFELSIRGDDYWLREAWRELFAPNLGAVASEILTIADLHLRRAHRLLIAGGSANPGWDPASFSRSAIEPHDQDTIAHPIDILIDAARDSVECLLATESDLAVWRLHSWASSDVPLLRRLAVHGWLQRHDLDATAKLEWLHSTGWLFDHQLRHEVFRLIGETLVNADMAVGNALVAEAVNGPPDGGEHRAYEAFNLLTWMVRHAPGLKDAQEALDRICADHPDFDVRNHPDLVAWSEMGTVSHRPPMAVDALHGLIGRDPVPHQVSCSVLGGGRFEGWGVVKYRWRGRCQSMASWGRVWLYSSRNSLTWEARSSTPSMS